MKKLLTLFTAIATVGACSSKATTKSSTTETVVKGFVKAVDQKFVESKEMTQTISKIKSQLSSFNSKTPIATDNLAIAKLLVSIGANLVALPDFSDYLEPTSIKFGTQKFEPREYTCGNFANQSYKKEGLKVVCYINGKKSTTIKPTKTARFGPVDTKKYYNLGLPNNINHTQLSKSGAKLFISTSDDVVNTEVSELKAFNFAHLSSSTDLYIFMQTVGKMLGSNQSFVEEQLERLQKAYTLAQSAQEKGATKKPSIQFVYTTSDGKVYGVTKESFGYKLAKRFGFDSSVKSATAKVTHKFEEEMFSKSYGSEITRSSDLPADVLFVLVSSKFGVKGVEKNVPTILLESKAYKSNKALFYLNDAQFISEDTSNAIETIISKVYDN